MKTSQTDSSSTYSRSWGTQMEHRHSSSFVEGQFGASVHKMSNYTILALLLLGLSTTDGSNGLSGQVHHHQHASDPNYNYHHNPLGTYERHQHHHRRRHQRQRRHPEDPKSGPASETWSPSQEMSEDTTVPQQEWVFLSENATVVKAHIGSTAILDCKVKKGSQFGMMTWARLKDEYRPYSVLTIGDSNYVEDKRYIVSKPLKQQHDYLNWALQIQRVTPEDAGRYECQATTYPPQTIVLRLRVVEAVSEILGTSEKIIKSGSKLQLNCVLKKATEKPLYIFWYHDNRMINYDTDRGVLVSNEDFASTLVLAKASTSDTGNYTCSPYNIRPSSVTVHVMNGGNSAASVQNEDKSPPSAAVQSNAGFRISSVPCRLGSLVPWLMLSLGVVFEGVGV